MQFNTQQNWGDLDNLTGRQIHLLHQRPKNIQQSLLLLNAHRHLIQRSIILKGINQAMSYLLGSFSNLALQIEYLAFARQHNLSSNELPKWKDIFTSWINAKQQGQLGQNNLAFFTTIGKTPANYFQSQEIHIVFLNNIAENLLHYITNKKVKLQQLQANNLEQVSLRFSISQILQFVDLSLPRTLMNFIMKRQELPDVLQGHKQLECLYCNRQMEYVIKRCPNYSLLLLNLIKIILKNMKQLNKNEEKIFMDIAIRYFYAHHKQKKFKAVQIFILTVNNISEPVRFAMTNEFILFLHIAKKIGKQKFVTLILQKSNWLLQISQKSNDVKKAIGYRIDKINPFSQFKFGEKIHVQRGTSVLRYLECIEDHSILFLKVNVENLDINIRIEYVGDCIKTGQANNFKSIELGRIQKSLLSPILLPYKGIYSIQFDNSQSWINSKTVIYEKVILNAISIRSKNRYSFLSNYYLLQDINSVTQPYLKEYSEDQKQDKVFISKGKGYFRFSLVGGKNSYEYQTDNSSRFLQKVNELLKSQPSYEFYIDNNATQLVKEIGKVQQFVKEKIRKNDQFLTEISLKY